MIRRLLSVFFFLPAAAGLWAQSAAVADSAAWQAELSSWRTAQEKQVSAPGGWLSLVSLNWLKSGFNAVGSEPSSSVRLPENAPAKLGLITVSGKTVQLLSPTGGFPAGLTLDGRPAREGQLATSDASPSVLAWKGLQLVVLERAGRFVVRVKDENAPARTGFHGLNWFKPDAEQVVVARWIPFHPAQTEEIPTPLGNPLELPAPGLAMFLLHGKVYQLEPVIEDPQSLFFILRDQTSHTTSFAGGRFLHTSLPDHGLGQPGKLVLDFNRLENPPCAYSALATCPLAPEQNRLDTGIEAGEKRFLP
ncbi:DUF1684 domain-containing protein [Telmatobacter bradus]|uniref:DUF1684 domain-containing protein n=1 Tax=Telmatobacter bradus TaxID=474953 RepID=UPI003B43D61F